MPQAIAVMGIKRKQMPDERGEIVDGRRTIFVGPFLEFHRAFPIAQPIENVHVAMRRDVLGGGETIELGNDGARIFVAAGFGVALAE